MTTKEVRELAPVIRRRVQTERAIIRRLAIDAIAAGWTISVDDGGDELALEDSKSVREVLLAMLNTDEDTMLLRRGQDRGKVWFIYGNGNDGCDVIADHSTSLDALVEGAMQLSERMEERATR